MFSNQDVANQISESDDSFGFSDTGNHDESEDDENEDATVADTTSGQEDMEEVNNNKNQDASGASSENFTSADLAAGYIAIFNPPVPNSSSELSQNSRDERHIRVKKNVSNKNRRNKKSKRPTKSQPDSDQAALIPEDIPEDILVESEQNMNHPNGEPMECKCPRGRLHRLMVSSWGNQCPRHWKYPIHK